MDIDVEIINIMQNDAFSMASMTDAINLIPYVPGRIGQLGIFGEKGVKTELIGIEFYNGSLSLLPTVPRGGDPTQNQHKKRDLKWVQVPHIPLTDAVKASEIRNVRGFATGELQDVKEVLTDRMREMTWKFDATIEHQMAGAIQGNVTDSDGVTVLADLYSIMGVTPTTIDFTLGTATTGDGYVAPTVNIDNALRTMESALGMFPKGRVMSLVGDEFWDELITHPELNNAFQRWQDTAGQGGGGQMGDFFRKDMRYEGFYWRNVYWINYRQPEGMPEFFPSNGGSMFPMDVPNMFKVAYAPADFFDSVNKPGLPRYAKQVVDKWGRQVDIWMESNPMAYCTRPNAVIQLTTSN